ncbi:hypothetical protein DFO67_10180 [Modicisalibacter xianhensis]|uniref:Uncharacterized protein n=1 Tax=Modicisalibacter xianhensis TaxID=442341 RepID=A0A4V3GUY9_9GAMM|nr:hypothetical protein DFO67_10180 [Halomonas xianhensis]
MPIRTRYGSFHAIGTANTHQADAGAITMHQKNALRKTEGAIKTMHCHCAKRHEDAPTLGRIHPADPRYLVAQ